MLNTNKIDQRIKTRVAADLFTAPIIIRVNSFTEESAKEFSENMCKANDSGQPVIPIIIDSYGGEVYSLLSMVDAIRSAKVPVATIVEGKAMSCGSMLLTFGSEGYRYMGPTSTLMIHEVSLGTRGKVEEIKADVNEANRLNQMVFKMMAQNVGKEEDYFIKLNHDKAHADWYLNPTEARTHNLINHIRIPELISTISVETRLT